MKLLLGATLGAVVALVLVPAGAQVDPRRALEQKIEFVGTLVQHSPLATRINSSSSDEARELLRQAIDHHRAAVAALTAGDLEAAERDANQAILSVGKARQLVPDDMRRAIEQRVRYQELRAATETLVASYERHRKAAAQPIDAEWTETLRMLDRAQSLHASERLGDAAGVLVDAQQRLLRQMSALLGNQTIDYTVRFESSRQEFDYELARYRSMEGLVPVALKELNPRPEARASVDGHVERSRRLVSTAQRQVADRPETAVATLREAVIEVQRALSAAGLEVPQ
ncbi:MAG: Tetratricopeptide 4 [Burkholderiaceae bacterium]|nr:Tetratricopeptide 4 [Burkholderiaceae bacterium]